MRKGYSEARGSLQPIGLPVAIADELRFRESPCLKIEEDIVLWPLGTCVCVSTCTHPHKHEKPWLEAGLTLMSSEITGVCYLAWHLLTVSSFSSLLHDLLSFGLAFLLNMWLLEFYHLSSSFFILIHAEIASPTLLHGERFLNLYLYLKMESSMWGTILDSSTWVVFECSKQNESIPSSHTVL